MRSGKNCSHMAVRAGTRRLREAHCIVSEHDGTCCRTRGWHNSQMNPSTFWHFICSQHLFKLEGIVEILWVTVDEIVEVIVNEMVDHFAGPLWSNWFGTSPPPPPSSKCTKTMCIYCYICVACVAKRKCICGGDADVSARSQAACNLRFPMDRIWVEIV